MKKLRVSIALAALLSLLVAGCGKTTDQVRKERTLNAEVTILQKDVETSISRFPALAAKLDAALQTYNELEKKYAKKMKDYGTDDLTLAGQMLQNAQKEAESILKGLTAYDQKAPHDRAVAVLSRDKESLMKISEEIAATVKAINRAAANHEEIKNSLTKKP